MERRRRWRATVGADLESPAGYAFQTGEPVISNHLENERRFRTPELLAKHGVKRAINVLIQHGGKRFGVLEVDSPIEGKFSQADRSFLQSLAVLLGVAIERHEIEKELRRNERLLQDAVAHQELLTGEISHRVKNSLSLVVSLLGMHAREAANPEISRLLQDAQMRVQTIASVHDRLWRAHEVRTVNLVGFLGELCEQLASSAPGYQVTCDMSPVTVGTDQAVALGLIVNEVVTNAFKYAYSDGSGEVRVRATIIPESTLRLEVADSGKGLPADWDKSQSTSLGMKLIAGLADQLHGRIAWEDAGPGTRFVLLIPTIKPQN